MTGHEVTVAEAIEHVARALEFMGFLMLMFLLFKKMGGQP